MLFLTLTADDCELEQLLCIVRDLEYLGYDPKTRKSVVYVHGTERHIRLQDDTDWLLKESRRCNVSVTQVRSEASKTAWLYIATVRPKCTEGLFADRPEMNSDTITFEACSQAKAMALGIVIFHLGERADLRQLKWRIRDDHPNRTNVSLAEGAR